MFTIQTFYGKKNLINQDTVSTEMETEITGSNLIMYIFGISILKILSVDIYANTDISVISQHPDSLALFYTCLSSAGSGGKFNIQWPRSSVQPIFKFQYNHLYSHWKTPKARKKPEMSPSHKGIENLASSVTV